MSNSRMMSSAFSEVRRVSNVSTRTFGFRSWIRAVADLSFDTPTVDVPCRIWRCRLVLSTTSKSSRPHEQDARRLELLLSLDAHIGKDEVARVAPALFGRKLGQ